MKKQWMMVPVVLVLAGTFALAQDYPVVAYEDNYTTAWDSVLTVASPGLMENDRAQQGDTLRAFLVNPPQVGELTLGEDGAFTYTPEVNAQGPVTFLYGIENQDGDTAYANATILVTPGNKPPLAITDYYTIRSTDRLIVPAPGVLANDIDLDGDLLGAELVTVPQTGILDLDENGGFWYQPNSYYSGHYNFHYRAVDARGGVTEGIAYVTVVSPNAPVAQPDHFEAFVGQMTPLYVLNNDSDADSNPLRVVEVSTPNLGSVEIHRSGVILFTADEDDLGRAQFTYTISDGVHRATTTVTVDVTDGDEPPVVVDDLVSVNQGDTVRFNPLANDYDPNGKPLILEWTSSPVLGSLQRFVGDWIYTPDPQGVPGVETLSYTASDGFYSTEGTVTIEVGSPNRAPIVNDDYAVVPLNRVINPYPVLNNDIDPDGDDLTISRFSAHGTDYLNIHRTQDLKGFSFQVFRPGTYRVDYWVTDGELESQGELVIFVDGPTENIARDDHYTVPRGASITLSTFANDVYYEHSRFTAPEHTSDVPGVLTYSNGDFHFMANTPFLGDTQFTYTLPGGSTATVTLTIIDTE
ncbi:Tandem-95 repeat protein [Sulfidibacter corallicola]|uniref:Tandem-95 repeat protein n=1 Tax=Sulfidibacter corallicola TaxID=2818388 RepID=A0A8A4TI43_SULCO|nr:Ig-like domain-containing protein [Sulfidibacter corallicola]QTD48448.1 tandem-95 repeat protein [Sulfidibacter corallicola]